MMCSDQVEVCVCSDQHWFSRCGNPPIVLVLITVLTRSDDYSAHCVSCCTCDSRPSHTHWHHQLCGKPIRDSHCVMSQQTLVWELKRMQCVYGLTYPPVSLCVCVCVGPSPGGFGERHSPGGYGDRMSSSSYSDRPASPLGSYGGPSPSSGGYGGPSAGYGSPRRGGRGGGRGRGPGGPPPRYAPY